MLIKNNEFYYVFLVVCLDYSILPYSIKYNYKNKKKKLDFGDRNKVIFNPPKNVRYNCLSLSRKVSKW